VSRDERSGLERDDLARLLGLLPRASLVDLAVAHGLAVSGRAGRRGLAGALAACQDLRLEEVVGDLLDKGELKALCRGLGLRVGGRKGELGRRILEAVSAPGEGDELVDGRWWPFERARRYVRALGLLDMHEWHAYSRGDMRELMGTRPEGIPAVPHREYREHGWSGFGDWLDSARHRVAFGPWAPFKKARRFARELRLASRNEWARWCRGGLPDRPPRPSNVPARPERVYGVAWRGWDDWLGRKAGRRSLRWRTFEAARAWARGLGLKNVDEWRALCRGERPDLGTRPDDVPACPDSVYAADGWTGWGDWLGTAAVGRQEVMPWPYAEARAFARGLGLRTGEEWIAYARGERPDLPPRPFGVPALPHAVYRDAGWGGMGDWLGTGRVALKDKAFRPFAAARAWARGLGLKSVREWRALLRGELPGLSRPDDVPASPEQTYRDAGWVSWGDFLGTGRVADWYKEWRPFAEARAFARALGLKSSTEWRAWVKGELPEKGERPPDIPTNPSSVYAGAGWKGFGDWLGTGTVRRYRGRGCFRPFAAARAWARTLGLRTGAEWARFTKGELPEKGALPDDVPAAPQTVYRDAGWAGWPDFLGTDGGPARAAAG